jgi:hypothetical protein
MRDRRWILELGVVLAAVASVLWGLAEPRVSLPALLRSMTWGVGIFAAWTLAWAWALHHDAEWRDLLGIGVAVLPGCPSARSWRAGAGGRIVGWDGGKATADVAKRGTVVSVGGTGVRGSAGLARLLAGLRLVLGVGTPASADRAGSETVAIWRQYIAVIVVLLLVWAFYPGMPDLLRDLLRALLGGR